MTSRAGSRTEKKRMSICVNENSNETFVDEMNGMTAQTISVGSRIDLVMTA